MCTAPPASSRRTVSYMVMDVLACWHRQDGGNKYSAARTRVSVVDSVHESLDGPYSQGLVIDGDGNRLGLKL